MTEHSHPQSPLLDRCPETLPAAAYHDPDWFAQERRTIWSRNWVHAGLLNELAPGTLRRVTVAGASVILCRLLDGALRAYHNTCRHRGAELCAAEEQTLGLLVTCPYHAWAYAATDGRLVSVAHATPTDDFRKADHGLHPVGVSIWNGFVFLNLSRDPSPLEPDLGLDALDNWPVAGLQTGHRIVRDLACNWKVFWENYNECLHCPGIHPALCERVPVYGLGVMSAAEAAGWTPDAPEAPSLKSGAESWTPSGALCGPAFPGLTPRQRQDGHTFVTVWPTMYVVAHADHLRAVTLEPTGPETTRLTARWLFPPETLAQPGFDAAQVASFAMQVIAEDGAAVEMNQRGLRSPAYIRGRLMPQEFEIHRFHGWVLAQMAGGDAS